MAGRNKWGWVLIHPSFHSTQGNFAGVRLLARVFYRHPAAIPLEAWVLVDCGLLRLGVGGPIPTLEHPHSLTPLHASDQS